MSAFVTALAWLEPAAGAAPVEGWLRLPDPTRAEVDPLKKDNRFARIDRAAKVLALAARRALGDRSVAGEGTGLVLASVTGSLEADERFDTTRVAPEGASPLFFPQTLPTAAAAELSIRLDLEGPVLAVSAGEASLLVAIAHALRWLARGEVERALVAGLEVAARTAPVVLSRSDTLVESACLLLLEREMPNALGTIAVASAEPETPGAGDARLLGNRAAPALVQALARPETDAIVSVRDHVFGQSLLVRGARCGD